MLEEEQVVARRVEQGSQAVVVAILVPAWKTYTVQLVPQGPHGPL